MRRSFAIILLVLAAGATVASLAACNGPHPFIREGDANSVEVIYAGDLHAASLIAQSFCARYERSAAFANADGERALYNCVRQ